MNDNTLTLGVATIGDLLLEGRISTDGGYIEDVHLSIPPYQRPYKWSARNALQLLDDIAEAKRDNKEVYRVGTLILYRKKEGEPAAYEIVDGQQRAITFALLLNALGEDTRIDLLDQRLADNPDNRRNVPNNLQAFLRRVKVEEGKSSLENERKKRENQELMDYIKNQCEMIVVVTDDISEAFQFFDSQNTRGKSLYPHDLLKAYHLREMRDVEEAQTEKIVNQWEAHPQERLASLFNDYLYRIKEWSHDEKAAALNEQNIHIFKGLTGKDRTPYAQFHKGSYAYAEMVNRSHMPFVSGARQVSAFQLNAPVIAGRPFFEYTQHYLSLLEDIQDNGKYKGFYVNDNDIVKTLDAHCSQGMGNRIVRLMFDAALLSYADRFCPETFPTKDELKMFDLFVLYAFIWAYSLRAQYTNLGWRSAQNYILRLGKAGCAKNSMNMYKTIGEACSPESLLNTLADMLLPLQIKDLPEGHREDEDIDAEEGGTYKNYKHYFKVNNFLAK